MSVVIDLVDSDDETNPSTFSPNVAIKPIERKIFEVNGAESRKRKRSDQKLGLDKSERPTSPKTERNEVELIRTETTPDRPNSSKEDSSFAGKRDGVFVPFKGREMTISTKIQTDPDLSASRRIKFQKTEGKCLISSAPYMSAYSPNVAVTTSEQQSPEENGAESRKGKRLRDSEEVQDQKQAELSSPKAKRNEVEIIRTDTTPDRPNSSKADTSFAWKVNGVFVPFKGREMTISTKLNVPHGMVAKAPNTWDSSIAMPSRRNWAGPIQDRDIRHSLEIPMHKLLPAYASIQIDPCSSDEVMSETKPIDKNDLLLLPSFGNSCLENLLPTSQSYQQIETRLKSTISEIEILKIERLDDPRRRKKYEAHRSFLSDFKVRNQLPRD